MSDTTNGPRWLFPGSFDPLHLGHLDLIQRASQLLAPLGGRLIVAVAMNPDKPGWMPVAQRLALLRESTANLSNVDHDAYAGATLHFARQHGVTALIRGLRHAADLEGEKAMAEVHRSHGLDTLFLVTDARWSHLSSQLVRNVVSAQLPVAALVPAAVATAIEHRP
jgi:pantetheine-phosphate adenylyltransferase